MMKARAAAGVPVTGAFVVQRVRGTDPRSRETAAVLCRLMCDHVRQLICDNQCTDLPKCGWARAS